MYIDLNIVDLNISMLCCNILVLLSAPLRSLRSLIGLKSSEALAAKLSRVALILTFVTTPGKQAYKLEAIPFVGKPDIYVDS